MVVFSVLLYFKQLVCKMGMCWAPDFTHYNARETCRFFKFPRDEKERNRWKKLLRRTVEPGVGAYVCSCHFEDGKKENGPKLFNHNKDKAFNRNYASPEKKKRRTVLMQRNQPADLPQAESEVMVDPTITEVQSCTQAPLLTPSVIEAQNYFLKQECDKLKGKCHQLSVSFSYDHICHNDKLILLYTGLPNGKIFIHLYKLFEDSEINYYLDWRVTKISKIDQLLITLMKLRQNFPHEDLANRFSCSQATISNVVLTWISMLHIVLFKQLMAKIPSREKNKSCLPSSFSTFTNCRLIIDCTEIYSSVARNSMNVQRLTYSSYKHRNTWKGLIGVVTYLSSLYPGSTSDKQVVGQCGILNQLVAGDLILADKGFLIRDMLPAGVNLNIPPFLCTPQFTTEQVYQTESIARARIHVERAIGRMKCYKILDFIPYSLLPQATKIFQVVGALTNLQYPLIKEVEQYYRE